MIQKIPVKAIPNQRFNIVLNDQNCTVHLYQRGEYLYLDFIANERTIRTGTICLTDISLLQYPTPYFMGFLFFVDTKRMHKVPTFDELGTRFILCYSDGE